MTFPVIFLMISTHFPSTYGHSSPWLVLTILILGSAVVKHFMNLSIVRKNWLGEAIAAGLITLILLIFVILNANPNAPVMDLSVLVRELLNLLGRWVHVILASCGLETLCSLIGWISAYNPPKNHGKIFWANYGCSMVEAFSSLKNML